VVASSTAASLHCEACASSLSAVATTIGRTGFARIVWREVPLECGWVCVCVRVSFFPAPSPVGATVGATVGAAAGTKRGLGFAVGLAVGAAGAAARCSWKMRSALTLRS